MEGGYDGVLCGGYGFDSRDEGIETEALYGGKCAGKEGKETGPRTNAITCAGIDPRKQIGPNNVEDDRIASHWHPEHSQAQILNLARAHLSLHSLWASFPFFSFAFNPGHT